MAAGERRPLLAHEQRHDLDRLLEPVDPFAGRGQFDAVPPVLVLVPACAEPQDQAAAAHVIDRDRLLQEHGRVPERVARHQHPEPDPARACREGRQERPAFETTILRGTVRVHEMIDDPRVVEPEILRHPELVEDVRPALVGLAHEEAEAHGSGRFGHRRNLA